MPDRKNPDSYTGRVSYTHTGSSMSDQNQGHGYHASETPGGGLRYGPDSLARYATLHDHNNNDVHKGNTL